MDVLDPRPAWKQVIYLAWPVLAQQALLFSVGIYDRFLAGNNLPDDPSKHVAIQAAQTQFAYLLWFISCYGVLVTAGSVALVARFTGAREPESANRTLHQSILLAVLLGALGGVTGLLTAPTFVRILGLEGDTAVFTLDFLRPLLLLLPFQMLELAGVACLVGRGDTRTGPIVSGLVALFNLPLAWSLFHGVGPIPRLGYAGIAFGTAMSHVIGSLIVLAVLIRGHRGLKLHWRELRPNPAWMYRILRISVPAALDSMSVVVGQFWFLSIVNKIGDATNQDFIRAAHGHALQWEALGYLSGYAFGIAAMSLVGQNLGANRSDRAAKSGWTALALAVGVMSFMGLLFFTLAVPMFRLFVIGEHQRPVIDYGVPVLRLVAFAMPALACTNVLTASLRGAGDTRRPVLITWAGFLGVRIPLAYWLALGAPNLGLFGAWLAMFADLYVRGVLFLAMFARGKWKTTRV